MANGMMLGILSEEEKAGKRTGLFGTRGGQANIGVTTGWHVITPEPSLYGPTLDIQLPQINMAVDLRDARCSLTWIRRSAQDIGP
jgi:hypothetical protein